VVGYRDLVIADGASHFWRLGETSGTSAIDLVGGASGTISGGVTLGAAGALSDGNKAMVFDGTTGKIVTAGNITVPVTATIEAWAKTAVATNYKAILSNRGGGTGEVLFAGLSNTNLAYVSTSAEVFGTRILSDGQWHHLVYVLNGTTCLFYVDGVLDVSRAFSRTVAGQHVLGIANEGGSYFWPGTLDEVALYPYALAPAQILAHYQARALPHLPGSYAYQVIQSGASNYWRLGEGSGTTAVDVVGGADGAISGGVTLAQPGAIADGNTAMTFNGTTGKVQTAALTIPVACTVELWSRAAAESGTYRALFSTRTLATGSTVGILLHNTWIEVYGKDPSVGLTGSRTIADSVWHHVVFVCTGTTATLYVDGTEESSNPSFARTTPTTGPAGIGFDAESTLYTNGLLDDIALYPRALTASEIAIHYHVGKATFAAGSYPERVLLDGASNFWRLGEVTGASAVDVIGGAHGTISGGVAKGVAGAVGDGDPAMVFDGATGKIVTAATVTIPVVATVEAWVKSVVDGTFHPIIALGSGQTPSVYLDPSSFVAFFDSVPGIAVVGHVVVPAGTWHHIVITLTGTTATFYLDGILDRTQPMARPVASTNLGNIANDPAFGAVPNGFFNGSLDDIAIYPLALTAEQIAQHYQLALGAGGAIGESADLTTLICAWLPDLHAQNPGDITTALTKNLPAVRSAGTARDMNTDLFLYLRSLP
jgi:hypothetical protein